MIHTVAKRNAIGDSLSTPSRANVRAVQSMLSQQYRLRKNARIQELRRRGRSWHTHQVVLIAHSNDRPVSRFAFSVSRRIGNAVMRNRIKRLMRESVRLALPTVQGGWDVLLIARRPARTATFAQIDQAITDLLWRARLYTSTTHPPMQATQLKGKGIYDQKATRQ